MAATQGALAPIEIKQLFRSNPCATSQSDEVSSQSAGAELLLLDAQAFSKLCRTACSKKAGQVALSQ